MRMYDMRSQCMGTCVLHDDGSFMLSTEVAYKISLVGGCTSGAPPWPNYKPKTVLCDHNHQATTTTWWGNGYHRCWPSVFELVCCWASVFELVCYWQEGILSEGSSEELRPTHISTPRRHVKSTHMCIATTTAKMCPHVHMGRIELHIPHGLEHVDTSSECSIGISKLPSSIIPNDN